MKESMSAVVNDTVVRRSMLSQRAELDMEEAMDLQDLDRVEAWEQAKRNRRTMLAEWLSEELRRDGYLVGTRLKMGMTTSYLVGAQLRWVSQNVGLASQMPMLRSKVDATGHVVTDSSTLDELQQRNPDWSREPALLHYLLKSDWRKFPPILVVVAEPWVNDPEAPEWGPDGRALRDSITVDPLDEQGYLVSVDFRNVSAYAADGQHRLIAIMALIQLIRSGQLVVKSRDGKPTKRVETRDELMEHFKLSDAELDLLQFENLGMELIPAVMEGENRDQARRRTRTVFVNVNKSARPVDQATRNKMDEEDGFAIIGRWLVIRHPVLKRDTPGDRVNMTSTALPAGSKWLTALTTIRDMSESYLSQTRPYAGWMPKKGGELPERPDDMELEDGYDLLSELWGLIGMLPTFQSIKEGETPIDEWREFPENGGRGHLMLRPIGQMILAKAVGYLHLHPNGPKLSLGEIFDKLNRFDASGGFNVAGVDSPWYGITYDPVGGRMVMSGRETAVQLLEYLVTGEPVGGRDKLLEEFRRLRTIRREGNNIYFNYNGETVSEVEDIELPPMIN